MALNYSEREIKTMEYNFENRLTPDNLQFAPNMTDQQKEHTYPILVAAGEMNMAVWYDCERCGLLIGTEKRGPLNLNAPLWVKDGGEAENVITMLELVRNLCGLKPDISLNEQLKTLLELLEGIVSGASPMEAKNRPAGATGRRKRRTAKPTPEQIMGIYREMRPQFLALGVEFEVDEAQQSVRYFNPRSRRHEIIYSACTKDLRSVRNLLSDLQERAIALRAG